MPEQSPARQPAGGSPSDTIWTVTKRSGVVAWQKMDAAQSLCTVCGALGVVAYVNCAGIVLDSGISAYPDIGDSAFGSDYAFCPECVALVKHRDLDALVARRLAVNPRPGLPGNMSAQEREPLVRDEFAVLFESLHGRELITSATSDFRFGITTGFGSGAIGTLSAPDAREPDCHRWIEQQGPIDPDNFENFKEEFRHRYSYAIPNRAALDAVAQYSPHGVLDFGAGNGYWRFVLESNGVNVRAVDQHQLPQNSFWGSRWIGPDYQSWASINTGAMADVAQANAMRTLLLVWPPLDEPMGDDALIEFLGDTVIYVGEWNGSTADRVFHNRLKVMWRVVESIPIPTLFGFFDRMRIYKRRPDGEARAILRELSERAERARAG